MAATAGSPSVCALVRGQVDGVPSAAAFVHWDGPLGDGLRRVLDGDPDWVWVLDGSVEPRSGALERLLAATCRVGDLPAAALICGVVLEPGGGVHPGRAPWFRRTPTELAMAAAERRLLPIRASAGPVLVHRSALEAAWPRAGAPFAPATVLEWTARMLRGRTGYMAPDSEYVLRGPAADPALGLRTAASLVAGTAFSGTDRVRVAFDLAERALRRARARAS